MQGVSWLDLHKGLTYPVEGCCRPNRYGHEGCPAVQAALDPGSVDRHHLAWVYFTLRALLKRHTLSSWSQNMYQLSFLLKKTLASCSSEPLLFSAQDSAPWDWPTVNPGVARTWTLTWCVLIINTPGFLATKTSSRFLQQRPHIACADVKAWLIYQRTFLSSGKRCSNMAEASNRHE